MHHESPCISSLQHRCQHYQARGRQSLPPQEILSHRRQPSQTGTFPVFLLLTQHTMLSFGLLNSRSIPRSLHAFSMYASCHSLLLSVVFLLPTHYRLLSSVLGRSLHLSMHLLHQHTTILFDLQGSIATSLFISILQCFIKAIYFHLFMSHFTCFSTGVWCLINIHSHLVSMPNPHAFLERDHHHHHHHRPFLKCHKV